MGIKYPVHALLTLHGRKSVKFVRYYGYQVLATFALYLNLRAGHGLANEFLNF